ncbi:recombinase family protein [uncultured Sphingomonas sp.]|uniref:recombinase family protein n=1 Tax=uncultured Sphingomonas sp. TaxID=158754 RepID=UPI0025DAAE95|nr:recombinase family protein [uncultured Sphingomonas sp.]
MRDRPSRCAIYTRKSTDEGLEQEFNSLHAQREACAAYILSQKHEGWQLLPEFYDDGGYSGGTMERPGLKQLMADVQAGKIDVIVVYKVDRLTRSLADFAKIVEVLDRAGASFVSVTQAFNTTTSMGRLTLNVLLSFAQFEREVTGERIRDKVAASKKKGMWMGGPVPLGYVVQDRKLVIAEPEAATVRHIFERYAALGSMPVLTEELSERGIRTKLRAFKDGRQFGGVPFTIGPLSHLLNNPVYVGEVRHKGVSHPGQHEPVVPRALWETVQSILASNRVKRRIAGKGRAPSLLTGMLRDAKGRLMSPTYAVKETRRYRYYVSRARRGEHLPNDRKTRVPAGELERVVVEQLVGWLHRENSTASDGSAAEVEEGRAERLSLATQLEQSSLQQRRELLLQHNAAVELGAGKIRISLAVPHADLEQPLRMMIEVDAKFVDRGSDLRLMIAPDGSYGSRKPDAVLLKLLMHAFAARDALLSGKPDPLTLNYSPLHQSRLARLSYLAPDIVRAIIEGRQPPALSGRRLLRAADLPFDWQGQRALLGFA